MKTYQLSRLYSLVMPVTTTQGTVIVEFKGVQNMKMRGIFSTSNPELQTLLEKSREFQQKVFRLVATSEEPEAKAVSKPDADAATTVGGNRLQAANNANTKKKTAAPVQTSNPTTETELF